MSENRYRSFAVAVVLIFAAYGSGLRNGYSLDDQFVTTESNSQVAKGLKGLPEIFTTPYSSTGGEGYDYRPLAETTFAFEYELFGWNTTVSHLVNLLLYCLLCWVVLQVLYRLFPQWSQASVLAVVVLFALHPLHNEVVNSLKNRDEILASSFGFAALLWFLKFGESKKVVHGVVGLCFFAVGFLAKTSIIPFAFFIPITLVLFKKVSIKSGLGWFLVLGLIGYLVVSFTVAISEVTVERELDFVENPLVDQPFWMRIINAPYFLLVYGKMLLVPYPLVSYYGAGQFEVQTAASLWPWAGMLLAVSASILAFKFRKKYPWGWWTVLGVVFFLGPYLNFPYPAPGVVAERFAFAAVLFVAVGVVKLFDHRSQLGQFVLAVAIIAYLFVNNARNPEWASERSLLSADVGKVPGSVKLNTAFAEHLHATYKYNPSQTEQEEQVKLAARHYLKAIELFPKHAGAYENLGILCIEVNQPTNAIKNLTKAIELGRNRAQTHFHLGLAYEQGGDPNRAKEAYLRALELDNSLQDARDRLLYLSD